MLGKHFSRQHFEVEVLLISTHNIRFYGELEKIVLKLTLKAPVTTAADDSFFYF